MDRGGGPQAIVGMAGARSLNRVGNSVRRTWVWNEEEARGRPRADTERGHGKIFQGQPFIEPADKRRTIRHDDRDTLLQARDRQFHDFSLREVQHLALHVSARPVPLHTHSRPAMSAGRPFLALGYGGHGLCNGRIDEQPIDVEQRNQLVA